MNSLTTLAVQNVLYVGLATSLACMAICAVLSLAQRWPEVESRPLGKNAAVKTMIAKAGK